MLFLTWLSRHESRAQDHLYKYVLAALTNTEKVKNPSRTERICKPVINEVLGKTIGWIPFSDFKGGKPERGTTPGSIGLQYKNTIGDQQTLDVAVAGRQMVSLYDSSRQSSYKLSVPESKSLLNHKELEQQTEESRQGLTTSTISQQDARTGDWRLNAEHPIVQDFMATQLEEIERLNSGTQSAAIAQDSEKEIVLEQMPSPSVAQSGNTNDSVINWYSLLLSSIQGEQTQAMVALQQATRNALPMAAELSTVKVDDVATGQDLSDIVTNAMYEGAKDALRVFKFTKDWLAIGVRSARGEQSQEVSEWKQRNTEGHPMIAEFMLGMKDSVVPIKELPSIAGQIITETALEALEAIEAIGDLSNRETIHFIKGESSETLQAIKLLAVFVGEEHARLKLNEETHLAKVAKSIAIGFDEMTPQERVKSLGKLVLSFYPVAALGQGSRAAAQVGEKLRPVSALEDISKLTVTKLKPNMAVKSLTVLQVKPSVPVKQITKGRASNSFNALSEQIHKKFTPAFDEIKSFSDKVTLDGVLYPKDKLMRLVQYLEKRDVHVYGSLDDPCFIARRNGPHHIYLPENPTVLEVKHELSHWLDYKKLGYEQYASLTRYQREKLVLERLQTNRVWDDLNQLEKDFSIRYVERVLEKEGGLNVRHD